MSSLSTKPRGLPHKSYLIRILADLGNVLFLKFLENIPTLRVHLVSICLLFPYIETCFASEPMLLTKVVRTDRSYFVCEGAGAEKICFEQYVAFTDQYAPTTDAAITIEGLRCASFGRDQSGDAFSLSGLLIEKAVGRASSATLRILKIRFYSSSAGGEPTELPRSQLTYVLAGSSAKSERTVEMSSEVKTSRKAFAKYFPDCKMVHFVGTELGPISTESGGFKKARAKTPISKKASEHSPGR